tara:strand:+ start:13911 stop:14366 length:456 start_codon:yes stop_codon:yes gene_type:complete
LINDEFKCFGNIDQVGERVWGARRLEFTDQVKIAALYDDSGFPAPQTIRFDGTNALIGSKLASVGRTANELIASSEFLKKRIPEDTISWKSRCNFRPLTGQHRLAGVLVRVGHSSLENNLSRHSTCLVRSLKLRFGFEFMDLDKSSRQEFV